ncbi:hypothetical protein D918_01267 [Trichuris suis]|nr:hypothetical protein D918_01267 [Trichuris suis]
MDRILNVLKDSDELIQERVKTSVQLDEMFRRESAAYNMLSKELPELPLTRCYCTWDKEKYATSLLVLQDLSKVARSADSVNGLTEEQLLSCVEAIAKLQAWSLNTKCDWKSFAPHESTLDKFIDDPDPIIAEMEKVVEKYPKHFGSVNLKDIAAFMKDKEAFTEQFTCYREVMPDVLVHGDYRASNILFKIRWPYLTCTLRHCRPYRVSAKPLTSAVTKVRLVYFYSYCALYVNIVRMKDRLRGTPLTGEMLKSALEEVLLEAAEDLNAVSAESIGEGEGFTSYILRVTLLWKKRMENVDLPNTVIAKMPTMDKLVELLKDTDEAVREKLKSSVDLDDRAKRNLENNATSLLVLEDLSKVARSAHLVSGLTEDQLLNCVEAIAKLQAWSLSTKRDWKSFAPIEYSLDKLNDQADLAIAEMEKVVEKYPKHFGSVNLKNIAAFMKDKQAYTAQFMCYREVMPDVLVHGDYRASNILFKVENGTNTAGSQLAAIIDWQMAHQGSFAEDICYLIMFSVNIGPRRSKMEDIVRHYFQTMKTSVPSIMDSVSFDSVWQVFEKTLSWLTLFYTPVVVKVNLPACKGEPAAESVLLTSVAEGYKDAVRFFNIGEPAL